MENFIEAKQPIVVEEQFNTPVSNVWRAITDKDEMKTWYFDLPDFKAEIGFKFQFSGGPSPEEQYLHLCEVTEVIPEEKLTYSWSYKGYHGKSYVTFDLSKQGEQTLLKLTHSDLDTFPQENPAFSKDNFKLGWNEIIHDSLKNYLSNKNFHYNISVNLSPKEIYESLTLQIHKWWSEAVDGDSKAQGDVFTVRFGNTYKTILVEELTPNTKVVWRVVKAFIDNPALNNKNEWEGTRIIWDISADGGNTKLTLVHIGLTPELECYEICEEGWASFVQSLYQFLTTGTGIPFLNNTKNDYLLSTNTPSIQE